MFFERVPLYQYSNYRIGGPARYFFEPESIEEIGQAVKIARELELPILILGGGTNLLISDEGFKGVVIRPNFNFIEHSGGVLRAGAGVTMPRLLDYAIANSLSGLEWAGGLPGTLGGAIYGNAGCFGGEIKDLILEVASLDICGSRPRLIIRNNQECGFTYRSSVFKRHPGREIIISAVVSVKKGVKRNIRSQIEEKIKYRLERQPLEYPNIGSIFKNIPLQRLNADYVRGLNDARVYMPGRRQSFLFPVKIDPFPLVPAAHLISEAGLKGVTAGGAMISPKHPNFIVNAMNSRAADVLELIRLAKDTVSDHFGIALEEEIEYVS